MPTARTMRGSDKLMRGHRLDQRELAALTRITQLRGVKVVDWTILGQPAPDHVRGSVHVSANAAAKLLGDLVRLRKLRLIIDVFPLGIPTPKMFEVKFRR